MVFVEFSVVQRRSVCRRGFGSRSAVRLEVVLLRARIGICGRRSPSTTIGSPPSFPERGVDDDIKDAFEVVEEYSVRGAFKDQCQLVRLCQLNQYCMTCPRLTLQYGLMPLFVDRRAALTTTSVMRKTMEKNMHRIIMPKRGLSRIRANNL